MSVLANDNVSFGEAAKILLTDAALSAEILRLANSPLGGRFGSSTILHALSLLGIPRVSALVGTLGMSAFLKRAGSSPLVRCLWRHNLASALAAKELAPECDLDPDKAYLAALLHDVGRLVLLMNNQADYQKLIAQKEHGCEAEFLQFGIDHCQAGAWLIREWHLPEIYAQAAEHHHDQSGIADPLIALTRSACRIAGRMGFWFSVEEPEEEGIVLRDEGYFRVASTINALECDFGFF